MTQKKPAHNGRFRASGGVAPQKRQCDFGSFAPARAAVNPRLREAASTLNASFFQQIQAKMKEVNWKMYPERQISELPFGKFTLISNICS